MNDSKITAYVIAAVVLLVMICLAALSATLIKYQRGANPKDKQKRKIFFWLFGALCPVIVFIAGYFTVYSNISIPTLKNSFLTHLSIGAIISLVVYIILGVILSKMFRNGKIGHWF